jgi:glucose/arabinose dehydrogenase
MNIQMNISGLLIWRPEKHIMAVKFFLILIIQISIWTSLISPSEALLTPVVKDRKLKLEQVTYGLDFPTSMEFLGMNDIIVLEKNKGTVVRIVDGNILPNPLLDIAVANENERGLLGLSIGEENRLNGSKSIYLFFTESGVGRDNLDFCPEVIDCLGDQPKGNRLYKYQFKEDKLVKPELLLDLPSSNGSNHIGGVVEIGPDDNIYVSGGDASLQMQTSNVKNGSLPDGRGGILRMTQDGEHVETSLFGNEYPLNLYYAYGVRNSFGITFDPLSGKLWDTENGKGSSDELNLVQEGLNSGWNLISGISERNHFNVTKLVTFNGKGKYSDPEFVWNVPVGVTSLVFLNSDKYGEKYENDLFVADINNGNIYNFDLTADRNSLILNENLSDKVADNKTEYKDIVFAEGFGGITDLEIGPDGYMYILTFHERTYKAYPHYYGNGAIYRIVPE